MDFKCLYKEPSKNVLQLQTTVLNNESWFGGIQQALPLRSGGASQKHF